MIRALLSALALTPCASAGGCQECGGYSCDDWIAWDPSRYSCAELERDYHCDCSGCRRCSSGLPRLKEVLFSSARYPGAVCLDGSPGGYYIRKGRPDAFLLFFEGGGWCYDESCTPSREGTLRNCLQRSQGHLGSSRNWSKGRVESSLEGMLSDSPTANPHFHNFTLVYLPYCDGASFTGDSRVQYEGSTLHFAGSAILSAIIDDLQRTTSISSAKRVVISGGSAGASAVYFHADKLVERLGLSKGIGVAAPDAGFFLDLPDRTGVRCWPNQMRSLWAVANASWDLHAGCLARYPAEPSKCLFPEYYADLIQTRWINIMSLYDSSELWYTLRFDCCPGSCGHLGVDYPKCHDREMQLFQDLRVRHLEAWQPLARKPGNGQWAPACIAHTMSWNHWRDGAWEVPSGSGNTMDAVVHRWLVGDNTDERNFNYTDSVAWPQNQACQGWDYPGGPAVLLV